MKICYYIKSVIKACYYSKNMMKAYYYNKNKVYCHNKSVNFYANKKKYKQLYKI